MPAVREATRSVFDRGERLGKQFIESAVAGLKIFNPADARFPLVDLCAELVVAQALEFNFDLINPVDGRLQALEQTRVFRTDNFFEQPLDHGKFYAEACTG